MEPITLYYRNGTADKVYQISPEQNADGYLINFHTGEGAHHTRPARKRLQRSITAQQRPSMTSW